jgi:GNAT superfamily N-acetyltransferase
MLKIEPIDIQMTLGDPIRIVDDFLGRPLRFLTSHEQVWGAWWDGELAGYAAVSAVAGLPQLLSLWGGVIPHYRRRGIGRALLERVLAEAWWDKATALSAAVEEPDGPAVDFLRASGFVPEHEEVLLALPQGVRLPTAVFPAGIELVFRPPNADYLFSGMYKKAFKGLPWYQPYDAQRLPPVDKVFFIEHKLGFAGVAALIAHRDGRWQIEPLAILPAYQRQGLGRQLLLAVGNWVQAQSSGQLLIGTWATHTAALSLYQSLGFVRESAVQYWQRPLS